RIDRVRAVRPTGDRFEPRDDGTEAGDSVYRPRPDDPRVTLRLAPSATWVVESYPHEHAERLPDGSWKVVLAVSEAAWLERLLLSLGPDASVEGSDEKAKQAAARAAERILARYRHARVG